MTTHLFLHDFVPFDAKFVHTQCRLGPYITVGESGCLSTACSLDPRLKTGVCAHFLSFTAKQPVTFLHDITRATDSSDEGCVAAVDVGANNFVAVTTTQAHQRVFHARPLFDRFHHYTERIAELQSQLPEDADSSQLIGKLYRLSRRMPRGWTPGLNPTTRKTNH